MYIGVQTCFHEPSFFLRPFHALKNDLESRFSICGFSGRPLRSVVFCQLTRFLLLAPYPAGRSDAVFPLFTIAVQSESEIVRPVSMVKKCLAFAMSRHMVGKGGSQGMMQDKL